MYSLSLNRDDNCKWRLYRTTRNISLIPQRSERKGTIMMVLLPSECRESKVRYPVPWDGKEGNASWVQGLP